MNDSDAQFEAWVAATADADQYTTRAIFKAGWLAAIDAALKGPAAPVARGEPVAEVAGRSGSLHIVFLPAGHSLGLGDKLYAAPTAPVAQPREPLHVCVLIDWLHSRYKAAGGKEGITDVSAWAEEVMRWTEGQHGITKEGGAT